MPKYCGDYALQRFSIIRKICDRLPNGRSESLRNLDVVKHYRDKARAIIDAFYKGCIYYLVRNLGYTLATSCCTICL